MGQGCDLSMSERSYAVSNGSSTRSLPMRLVGMLHRLPRMLVSRQMILFSLLLRDTMGVRGAVA
jgi:hypothetical protein